MVYYPIDKYGNDFLQVVLINRFNENSEHWSVLYLQNKSSAACADHEMLYTLLILQEIIFVATLQCLLLKVRNK